MLLRHCAMRASRSGILFLSQAGEHPVDDGPLLVLGIEGALADLLERVVFSLSAGFGLGPAGLDPTSFFHPVEDGIEHAVGPLDAVAGAGLDFLDNGVAVALAAG